MSAPLSFAAKPLWISVGSPVVLEERKRPHRQFIALVVVHQRFVPRHVSQSSFDFAACRFSAALGERGLNHTRSFDAKSRERGGADSRVVQTVVGLDPLRVQITQQ